MQSRNKLLLLSKKELYKECKKLNLNTTGCLAKMDLVQLLLNPKPRSRKSSNAKPRTPKKTNSTHKLSRKSSKKHKTRKNRSKTLGVPKKKGHKKKGKNLSNISAASADEPAPTPADVDPSAMSFDMESDDDEPLVSDPQVVRFGDLPWEIEEELKLKKEDSGHSSPRDIENKIYLNETSLSPKSSKEIVTIKPGFPRTKSLKTVYAQMDQKNADKDHELDILDDSTNIFEQIDSALADYYKSFERGDYFNDEGEGKFLVYCKEKALDDVEELEKYFGSETDLEPTECRYLGFDDKFPLIQYAPRPDEEQYDKEVIDKIEIYNVIEYCYHHKKAPT